MRLSVFSGVQTLNAGATNCDHVCSGCFSAVFEPCSRELGQNAAPRPPVAPRAPCPSAGQAPHQSFHMPGVWHSARPPPPNRLPPAPDPRRASFNSCSSSTTSNSTTNYVSVLPLLFLSAPSLETQLCQLIASRSKACAQYLRNSVRRRPAPSSPFRLPADASTSSTIDFAHPSTSSAGSRILAIVGIWKRRGTRLATCPPPENTPPPPIGRHCAGTYLHSEILLRANGQAMTSDMLFLHCEMTKKIFKKRHTQKNAS